LKKVISLFLLCSIFITSLCAQESEGRKKVVSIFEAEGLCLDTAFTKPIVAENLDEAYNGISLQAGFFSSFFGVNLALDWQYINDTNYLPLELAFNLHLPISFFNGAFHFDPYAGIGINECLWNDNPIYGFSWTGGLRILVPNYILGVNAFYKHSYYFPIRKTDSKVDVGKIGIGVTLFIDSSGF